MRLAIYAKVSTDDRGQDPENQLHELRDWCANAGHSISGEYVDYESGWKGAEKRRQHLATDNELVRNILLALLSSSAKVEAQKIADRTKAGMARPSRRASGSGGRDLISSCARRLPSERRKEIALTQLPRRSASTGIRLPRYAG